jgi:hypothetical protein
MLWVQAILLYLDQQRTSFLKRSHRSNNVKKSPPPNLAKSLEITTPNQGRSTFHTMQGYQSFYVGDAIHPISGACQWMNAKSE